MEFRILGPLEVVDDGRPVRLDRQRLRALLGFLLLHANELVSADRVIDEVWGPEPPKTAAASLQNYVSRLRKALGPELLVSRPPGYVLRVDPERFDLTLFERLAAGARDAEPRERAEKLRAALSLWRGRALEDLAFEPFAQEEARRLEEARLAALEERIDADLELGRDDLVGELEELVEEQPLRERFRGQLILALYRAGRQADALSAYQEARRVLLDELGLEPGEELRQLEQAILRQDPSLLVLERAGPERAPDRRTVTVLFCDLEDSTGLASRLDPEAYRTLMERYFTAVRAPIERHGGTVEKFIGDAVMAVFGVPELHEDDALRAVRAAVEVRSTLRELDELATAEWDVRLAGRIGLNTGEVHMLSRPGEDLRISGAAVSLASKLEEHAPSGEILLGEETFRLVRDAVRAEQTVAGDLQAWRLDDLVAGAPPYARRFDAPLVGREQELERLRSTYEQARDEARCRVVTIVGEAGIGKTRLARELVASVREEARVLVGRCVSYGEGATYLPIAEIVRQAAPEQTLAGIRALLGGEDDADAVAQRIAELIGIAESPAAPGETFWAVRRLFETLARERPLVVVLDDIHWAEPTLLDLVEYLGEWAVGPILVLCLARPDLLEVRAAWGGPSSTGFLVELEPLPAETVGALIGELAAEPIDPEVQARIVEHAGGNPLFAEQLLALAAEASELDLEKPPPTVEALLASRLDHLDPQELTVLRRAAIVGRRFTHVELDDLAPGEDPSRHLHALAERGLVHPVEDLFRFHHVLVREVAYRGIPKAERAELHELAARGLDRRDGADELVGYHFEQAYRYVTELGRPDEHARELATAGGERLGRAGIRAWRRADAPAAVNLLGRALDLLPESNDKWPNFACELAVALRMRGELDRAEAVLTDAVKASAGRNRGAELRARIELANVRTVRDPDLAADLFALASAAVPVFEAARDDRALGRAWLLVGMVQGGMRCENAAWEEAAARAAMHYRRAGWSPAACLSALAAALYHGPKPVDEAIHHCEELVREYGGDRASEASVLVWMGGLEALRKQFETGRELVAQARSLYADFGQPIWARVNCGQVLATVEALEGHLRQAEDALRDSCRACEELHEPALLSSRAAELSDLLYLQGRNAEAKEWAEVARETASAEDLEAQASWRSALAKVAAVSGEVGEAERLAREAVDLLETTDAVNDRAHALLDLAEVLRIAGKNDDALRPIQSALVLYDGKGNVAAAERARSLLTTGAPA